MTPMIDVVFLLLIFFVWTASFQIVERSLPSALTSSSGASAVETEPPPPEEDFDQVVIRIQWVDDGPRWQVNDNPVGSLAALRERLELIASINRSAPVVVHPDPRTPLGDVIDVYDAARLVHFEQVGFATTTL